MTAYLVNTFMFVKRVAGRLHPVWIFLFFFILTLIIYKSTLFDIPRSDHVLIFSILNRLSFPADTVQIAFLELLGHPRFQPLAWLLQFFQVKAFGFNFLMHHLFTIGLHALNGVLLFRLVFVLSRKPLFSFLTACIFITLFTHLPIIAWPMFSYSLLSVSLSLLAVLSLLKFFSESKKVYLYLAYTAAFVQLFLYEINVIAPAIVFLISVILGWSLINRRQLILTSISLAVGSYLIYGGLYLWLMPIYAGLPNGVLSFANMYRALAAIPIEFFNTIFCHNVFASSQILIDELLFFVPFTAKSFSSTTIGPLLIRLNFLAYLALIFLVVTVRRPEKGHHMWFWLLISWAVSYTFIVFLGRGVAYIISQGRHAYFPALLLLIAAALLYERYFPRQWSLPEEKGHSFIRRNGWVLIIGACVLFIGLNTFKTYSALGQYMEYRAYPNAIYYTAQNWLSDPANKEDKLFIAIPTYPPHEKLAWGTDIIPDIFMNSAQITKDLREATHILNWPKEQDSPGIMASNSASRAALKDDFSLTFGIMPHPQIDEDYLEIFTSTEASNFDSAKKTWWLRLYFERETDLEFGLSGIASVVLGYSQGDGISNTEQSIFYSQKVPVKRAQMNHFILVKENDEFGLIFNGELVEKTINTAEEEFKDIKLSPGKLYRMGYRKPYYFAHTFLEFGKNRYSIEDKKVGDIFTDITFNPKGFQEYHLSLDY